MKPEEQIDDEDSRASQDGLIFACLMDGAGGGRELDWDEVRQLSSAPAGSILWLHLDFREPAACRYIEEESGLSAVVSSALLAEEGRPRHFRDGEGLCIRMRGVNMNPGSTPDDMISIRLWVEPGRIITLRHRRLQSPSEMLTELTERRGVSREGEFLLQLITRIGRRISEVVDNIDDLVDSLEDQILTMESHALRPQISEIRRQIIRLRRYLAPQREVLAGLQMERVSWIGELDRVNLREWSDRTLRYVEDLDAARDRAVVASEELASRLSEQMNRNMYLLAIVAGIFLPLGLLTGLLGINVGGMPGVDSPTAFWLVCALLLATAAFMVAVFRRTRLM